MKVTSTWLLTSAAQIVITIVVGAFMIINAAVIGFYVLDGYSNYQKKASMDVVMTGRIHKFSSLEFTSSPTGTMRTCIAVTANGHMVVREGVNAEGIVPSGDFCEQLFSARNLSNWKSMAPTSNGSSITEKLFWSIVFFVVFIAGAFLITSIPANVVGLIVPALAPYTKVLALLLTFPVFLFWAVFVASGWSYHPSYWISPNGYSVATEKVFITRDAKFYKAPETVFGWSNNDTMEERKVFK